MRKDFDIPTRPPPPSHREIGLALRRFRESQGWALTEVARKLKVSVPHLSDLELGRRNWTVARRDKYLNILRGAK